MNKLQRGFSVVLSVVAVTGAGLAAACSDDTAATGADGSPSTPSTPATSTDAGTGDATADDDSGRTSFTPPPTCTSFTYSDWSICRYDGSQARSVASTVPADCYGGGPVLKQSCTFVVPTDAQGLYDAYCSSCHGNGKKGSSASAIKSAISGNRGGMSVLAPLLSDDQIALIASAK